MTLNPLGLVQHLTGDYRAAAASQQQALALFRELGDLHGQAGALTTRRLQQETGDYPAAAANHQQALAVFRDLGHQPGQADALNDLGLVQQETGDYPAAAASHQQALTLFADLGDRPGQTEALNRLGELSLRTSATGQAHDQHRQALAIAATSARPQEARALEESATATSRGQPWPGRRAPAAGTRDLPAHRRPGARRVQETLRAARGPG